MSNLHVCVEGIDEHPVMTYRVWPTVTSSGQLSDLCLNCICFLKQDWSLTLSWPVSLLVSCSLRWGRHVCLLAQILAALRMSYVTSVWCGVRPARRNTSAGKAMRYWLQEDARPRWKIWRAKISEKVRRNGCCSCKQHLHCQDEDRYKCWCVFAFRERI